MKSSFSRPNWAEIDLSALQHNVSVLAAHAASARLVAVMKANAYGHGVFHVSQALANRSEIALLGVASVDEALQLREGGIEKPILLLSAILPSEAREVVRAHAIPTVYTRELADALQIAAEAEGRRVPVHFKVDTGMSRLGAPLSEAVARYHEIGAYPNLEIVGIYTHFACADEPDDEHSPLQLAHFQTFLDAVNPAPHIVRHTCNSAGTLRYPQAHFDLVRPGLALYGAHPCPEQVPNIHLEPVMTWKARLTGIKTIPAGQSVSYGATWKAPRPTTLAIVPTGYADGYHRTLSNRAQVLVNGQRASVVGRVTMDQILVDVTDVAAHIGDEVVLFGRGLPVEVVAAWAGTISYELLCAVSARVPRVYL